MDTLSHKNNYKLLQNTLCNDAYCDASCMNNDRRIQKINFAFLKIRGDKNGEI